MSQFDDVVLRGPFNDLLARLESVDVANNADVTAALTGLVADINTAKRKVEIGVQKAIIAKANADKQAAQARIAELEAAP